MNSRIRFYNLNKLLNGLLDLAQADFSELEMKLRPIRIDEIILSAIDDCQRKYHKSVISFEYEQLPEDEERLVVLANEQWIKTAILNIIDNACKYSNDSKVEVLLNLTDVWIVIKVKDGGIGIPEKDLKNILEPFFRANNTKTISGHGIGLSLSNKIFKLHRGNIQILSDINKGTRVIMALPIKH